MAKIYTHPGQPQMQVEIIKASAHPASEKTIYTIRLRYPRIIHGEIMTHRVFGRNARSSRAVPFKTMLAELRSTPFIPWHWGQNKSGMQAEIECDNPVIFGDGENNTMQWQATREDAWLYARDKAVEVAEAMANAEYHKQVVNRLIEPFAWIDVLITSTDWDNFLWLRDHGAAEPHLHDLAVLVGQALDECVPEVLLHDKWHLPYIDERDYDAVGKMLTANGILRKVPMMHEILDILKKISAARCARISYAPFDGNASYEKEIERYDMLVSSDRVHASPTEHQATPDAKVGILNRGETYGIKPPTEIIWENPHLHGNLDGWVQARKLIPNESHGD